MIVFLIFVPILALVLILLNVILSPRAPYQEKNSGYVKIGRYTFQKNAVLVKIQLCSV